MSLELAIKAAKKNPIRKRGRNSISRFATVLTGPGGTFVGYNSYKTGTLQARFATKAGSPEKVCQHSEISAIAKAIRRGKVTDLTGYKMYIARLLQDDTPALSAPCEVCRIAIKEFNIKEVHWTE